MKVTITSIELKSIKNLIVFFKLNNHVIKQLKNTNCLSFKAAGFWKKYYTMTLWKNEDDIRAFARTGAHLEAMRQSKKIAKGVKTLTIEANELLNWKEAKNLLANM